ncbi:MAG: DNA cytosine methyltransferase [Planctomycetota bacterium]|nr:DNA cytosine methyltransferase [Planctomycetota bacterium]
MRAIDLFSGAGGFTTGATQAGAEVIWAANHWAPAVACHQANHPHIEHVEQDLGEMDWTQVPDADLLLASPACQGHSPMGQPARQGTGGNGKVSSRRLRAKGQRDRNTAYAVLAAADTLRPQSIVVENVVRFQAWEAFDAWLGVLQSFGYSTHVHTLNGLDYGGPQNRRRTIITANQGKPIVLEQSLGLVPPTIAECLEVDDHADNLWNAIASKPQGMQAKMRRSQDRNGSRSFWANVDSSRGRRLDEQFPTACTGSGTQWYLLDGDRGRVLNPREMARTMSLPEDYQLPLGRKLSSILIGNAIDVKLARGITEQVLAA